MNIETLTVEEVLAAVEKGEISADEALQLEQQGKNRKQLIKALQKQIGGAGDEEETENAKVTLLKNIKYNGKRYKIGEEIEVDEKDVEAFVKAKIIKG